MENPRRRVITSVIFLMTIGLVACGPVKPESIVLLQLAREADASFQAGRLATAKRQYEALLARNPRFVAAHARLGVIAYREGDVGAAREHLEQVARLEPQNGAAPYNLAMLDLDDARRYLRQYAALAPTAPNRAQVLALIAKLDEFARQP